jgi:hypothetical protein
LYANAEVLSYKNIFRRSQPDSDHDYFTLKLCAEHLNTVIDLFGNRPL